MIVVLRLLLEDHADDDLTTVIELVLDASANALSGEELSDRELQLVDEEIHDDDYDD